MIHSLEKPAKPTIRALCFDFDGTLAHFTGDYGLFVAGFRSELNLESCAMNTFAERLGAEERRDGHVTLRRSLENTLRALGQRVPDDLGQLVERAIAEYSAQVALLPGAREVLELCRAHKLPLALVSNAHADSQRVVVEGAGIAYYFTRILISGDSNVAVRKPDPRIFRFACAALGTKPEETLMVGDNLSADIRGARAAGLQAVYLGQETGPDYETVPDLGALKTWLEVRL